MSETRYIGRFPGKAGIGIAFAVLLLGCLLLSWPALNGPFLFDDFPNLQHLAGLRGELTWPALADYMRQYGGTPGRPLSMLSFVLNDAAWPSAPWAFKYTNLMLHLLIGTLVFGFARTLAILVLEERRAHIAALLTMAAWLLHPMQLSTSMLVVQRMTQLSMLFAISGLWGYVAFARRARSTATSILPVVILGLGTALAVLSKETGALAPLLAVVINMTLLRGHLQSLSARHRSLLHWGTLAPVLVMVVVIASKWDVASNFSNRDFTMGERLLSEARALMAYLSQILIPSLRGGGIYHDDFVVSRGILQPWVTLPAVLGVVALLASAVILRRRHPVFAFAVGWFFCGHILESSVFPLELYFEHRNYLPMFGPMFAMAFVVAKPPEKWRLGITILAGSWIVFAAFLTWVQAPIWGDVRKLTAIWAIEHPNSPRAAAQRAHYYAGRGQSEQAARSLLDAYHRGVRGNSFPLQALNIACLLNNKALAEEARPAAIIEMETSTYNRALLETMPKIRTAIQGNTCPLILTDEDWTTFTVKLLENPGYAEPGVQNYIHVERAYFFRSQLDLDSTMREFESAWSLRKSPKLAHLISATLASAGLYDEAEKWADLAYDNRLTGYQGWLSDDDVVSLRLKESLKQYRKTDSDSDSN